MIILETSQWKWASSRLEGSPPVFSRVTAGALHLGQGPQGPALVASGQASPHASCSGVLGIPLPTMPVPKTLCGDDAGT